MGEAALIGLARQAMVEAVTESAEDLVGKQMQAAPVDQGTLKASIHVEGVTAGAFEVSAITATGGEASEYAIPVHEGSVAHWIEAKDANGFLFWPGAAHPVERVFHPGAAPNKFMEGPLLANRPVYVAAMAAAVRGVF